MMRREIGLAFGVLVAGLGFAAPAFADDLIPGGEERWKFTVGGILARIDSGIGVNGATSNGTVIDLDGPAGKKEAASFLLGAQWRFADNQRLSGTFFNTSKTRSLSFNNLITIGDDTLVPPTTLSAHSKNNFLSSPINIHL